MVEIGCIVVILVIMYWIIMIAGAIDEFYEWEILNDVHWIFRMLVIIIPFSIIVPYTFILWKRVMTKINENNK